MNRWTVNCIRMACGDACSNLNLQCDLIERANKPNAPIWSEFQACLLSNSAKMELLALSMKGLRIQF